MNEPAAPGQVLDGDGFGAFVTFLRSAWPDLVVTHDVDVVSADGGKIAVRCTSRATHTSELFGVPAESRSRTRASSPVSAASWPPATP